MSLEPPEGFYDIRGLYWIYAARAELLQADIHEYGICEGLNEEGLVQAALTQAEAHSFIPEGTYCYTRNAAGVYSVCPFLDKINHFPKQSNGFCHYLKSGDFSGEGLGLLWDSCKECGIKEYRGDYETN